MVNQVYYLNSDKFPAIANDYSDTKARVEKITVNQTKPNKSDSLFTSALETIPTFRRTSSVTDKINNGDYLTSAGILGYTLVNIKEDINDVISAGKQIYSKIDHNYKYDPLYNRKEYQHAFSATRGMVGEETLYKSAANGNPFANKILDLDKTIDKTKFGEFINKIFKISESDNHKVEKIRNFRGKSARTYKFKSSVLGGKPIARAMKRTTAAGVAVMGILELPKIVKETAKGDNFFEHIKNGVKQTVKATANVAINTASIGILGAVGAQHAGSVGSLIGMGLGAIAGSKLSNQFQNAIG